MTEYYPSEMPGEEMPPELLNVDYDDGDEGEMDRDKVNAAVELAASLRSDD